MLLPRGKGDLLTRRSVVQQMAHRPPSQRSKECDMAHKTPVSSAGILLFAGCCGQSLEIKTVNHWLFIYLCNLSSAFLCSVQLCAGAAKAVNIIAYRK